MIVLVHYSETFMTDSEILVSPEDRDLLVLHPWKIQGRSIVHFQHAKEANKYFKSKTVRLSLSREIFKRMVGEDNIKPPQVLHLDKNFLNCQRENLYQNIPKKKSRGRTASFRFQKPSKTALGLYGVYKDSRLKTKPFKAVCTLSGETRALGYYATPEEAAQAYDDYVLRVFPKQVEALAIDTNKSLTHEGLKVKPSNNPRLKKFTDCMLIEAGFQGLSKETSKINGEGFPEFQKFIEFTQIARSMGYPFGLRPAHIENPSPSTDDSVVAEFRKKLVFNLPFVARKNLSKPRFYWIPDEFIPESEGEPTFKEWIELVNFLIPLTLGTDIKPQKFEDLHPSFQALANVR